MDGAGNLFIATGDLGRVRKISPDGIITTVAGTGPFGTYRYSGDGGLATEAHLSDASSVAVDGAGNVYVADTRNNVVRILRRCSRLNSRSHWQLKAAGMILFHRFIRCAH